MGAWEVKGPATGTCGSWRDAYPELAESVTRITAPLGRGIAWEGTEIWAYRDRPRNIPEILASNVARLPDHEAYVFYPGGQRLTWRDVGAQVDIAAARLKHEFGFAKRDRLCLLTAGCVEYVVGYLAILKLGGIAVPVNLGLTADGLAAQIDKVGAKGLIVSPDIWRDKLEAVRGQLDSVQAVFATGDAAPAGTIPFSRLGR
ncbi:MAG: AMP-binding protein, partial [Phreatobacter sp.]